MDSINGTGSTALSYAHEAYSANLAKAAQEQQGQQKLGLLQSAVARPVMESSQSSTNQQLPTQNTPQSPAASSGTHTMLDNLGQNIDIRV